MSAQDDWSYLTLERLLITAQIIAILLLHRTYRNMSLSALFVGTSIGRCFHSDEICRSSFPGCTEVSQEDYEGQIC